MLSSLEESSKQIAFQPSRSKWTEAQRSGPRLHTKKL